MEYLSQDELEKTAKVHQVESLRKDVHSIDKKLDNAISKIERTMDNILTNTKGVVTYEQMKNHVDERIKEKTRDLWVFKKNASRIGWVIVTLLLTNVIAYTFNNWFR